MQAWGSKGLHMLATLSQRHESINTYMTNTYMTNTYTLLISYYASEPASGRRIIATYQLVANSLSRQAIKCSHAMWLIAFHGPPGAHVPSRLYCM